MVGRRDINDIDEDEEGQIVDYSRDSDESAKRESARGGVSTSSCSRLRGN